MKSFKDTINWDIIDAPVPDQFFGKHATRANLVRHGIKNGIIVQSRVLEELKALDADQNLTPNSKYKANVAAKIKWIEEFYFPKCLKEIQWFEDKFGEKLREEQSSAKGREVDQKKSKLSEAMGNYKSGIAELL